MSNNEKRDWGRGKRVGGRSKFPTSFCPKFRASLFQPDHYVDDSNVVSICCVGHQALINQVSFSPDGRLIASAAFDKSVKIWNGDNGK